ncbi:MAG: hypothetical protein HN368_09965 [Spirochaetales bacterium]|jgi:hypothetical protein|nr:hypothetical protein [Spirochaetales bacterium]
MHPLLRLDGLSKREKAEVIGSSYPLIHNHPSGIFYSMQKIETGIIRPFEPGDFDGVTSFDFSGWRIKPEGPWEYRNNENSITTSGLWLAAQAFRFKAEPGPEVEAEAVRAFGSLRQIYQFGAADGRPGWMGKPYGFRLSDQTSPDQYLDAVFGLWLYREFAPPPILSEIDQMLVQFADYWKNANYTLYYLDRTWSCATEYHAYNAIFVAMQSIAYRLTGDKSYQKEAERLYDFGRWTKESKVDDWMNQFRDSDENDWEPNRIAGDARRPGEFLCWETTIHAKFAAVSAWIAHEANPDLVSEMDLAQTIETWWSTWDIGMGEDLLPYYFFFVDSRTGAWRRAPKTPHLPRDQWFLGQPGLSHTSGKRWTEPLARFMITSALAGIFCPVIAPDAVSLAGRLLDVIDGQRMRWQIDPDGKQLDPDQSDVRDVLSSEIPASFCITYWMGREQEWW